MAIGSTEVRSARTQLRTVRRALIVVAALVLLGVLVLAGCALAFSGVTLAPDGSALARVEVQPFGGSLVSVQAHTPRGRAIPLANHNGLLTPRVKLRPGQQVDVEVVVRRPGWSAWALGGTQREQLTIRAPIAQVKTPWVTTANGSTPQVSFESPVSSVSYSSSSGRVHQTFTHPTSAFSLGSRAPAGSAQVAAAARPWERLGKTTRVTWFPPSASGAAIAVATPGPGSAISPAQPIRLTFSRPVAQIFGRARPSFSPSVAGHWREINSHTLVFKPSGFGAPFGAPLSLSFPHQVAVAGPEGGGIATTEQIGFSVRDGSMLRLQQLLAEQGYLPLTWHGAPVARTASAQVQAAVEAPAGSFKWRYGNTPSQLQGLWSEGEANLVTHGAVMKFENENNLTIDGEAGQAVWRVLIEHAVAGRGPRGGDEGGYTYVYVHREIPETLTLWHDGRTVLVTAANTGISGAETELGSFAVFEHIPEGTMEGLNPDGSRYRDEGIKYISYFNGGDAVHYFDRSSFGVPQSLGCVELPLEDAAAVYPYMPIGTLVTIEG